MKDPADHPASHNELENRHDPWIAMELLAGLVVVVCVFWLHPWWTVAALLAAALLTLGFEHLQGDPHAAAKPIPTRKPTINPPYL